MVIASTPAIAQQDPNKLYTSAEAAFDEGDYIQALATLNACIKEDPGFLDAYFMRAETKERLRDLDGALTDYSILLAKIPDHPEALLNRAQLRYRLKKYVQAEEDFQLFLKVPSGGITQRVYFNQQARVNGANQIMTAQSFNRPIVFNYLGLIALHTHRHDEAVNWLDSAIQLQPGKANYYVSLSLS